MKTINGWQAAIEMLEQKKKRLEDDGKDTAVITARIQRYESAVDNLEDEMLGAI